MQFSVETDGVKLWQRIIEQAGTDSAITATSRPWGEGDYLDKVPKYLHLERVLDAIAEGKLTLYNIDDNPRYRVGQVRVLQPGRNKPGVWYRKSLSTTVGSIECSQIEYNSKEQWIEEYANRKTILSLADWRIGHAYHPARIRILTLDKLDVRNMTDEQARRTGFASAVDYLAWWASHYDKAYVDWTQDDWEYHKQRPDFYKKYEKKYR